MTLQEAKQKVASNHSYVDWYQLRAHCKGFEGDIDPRMLTYADEAAEIYCASQVAALTKENELLTKENWEMKRWSVHEENKALTSQVEKLKNDLADALDVKKGNGPTALTMLSEENSRLREEKKELVEALREALPYVNDCARLYVNVKSAITAEKIESLLSKFEVPNQS